MTLEIWKFTLQPLTNHIDMPDHARVLSVAFQGEDLRVWAVVVPSNVSRKRGFFVAGTGWPCDDKAVGTFVGAAFHPQGLVFHVFDHGYAPAETSRSRPPDWKQDQAETSCMPRSLAEREG